MVAAFPVLDRAWPWPLPPPPQQPEPRFVSAGAVAEEPAAMLAEMPAAMMLRPLVPLVPAELAYSQVGQLHDYSS